MSQLKGGSGKGLERNKPREKAVVEDKRTEL